jgi:hypothetical protein
MDGVTVPTTAALLGNVPGMLQICDDCLCGSLGYPGYRRKIANTDVWLLGDEEQQSPVVGEQRPVAIVIGCRLE